MVGWGIVQCRERKKRKKDSGLQKKKYKTDEQVYKDVG
jgi:hypothetical protein